MASSGAMSLATRCTICSTVFRVVPEQLELSEGWVRCGRCKEVFNALENLFDLEQDAAQEWRPSQLDSVQGEFAASPRTPPPAPIHTARAWPPPSSPVPLGTPAAARGETPAQRAHEGGAAAALVMPEAAPPPAHAGMRFDEATHRADATGREAAPGPDDATPAWADAATALAPAPDFLRQARARERWGQPRMRLALAGASAGLALLLLLQLVLHFRDEVAARTPAVAPLLAWACGCSLSGPRRLEDIVVESSALTRAPVSQAQREVLRLDVMLRNRANIVVAMPTIDLKLTDTNGALVVRRMLSAADFQHPSDLPAGSETQLQLQFTTGDQRIAGYTIDLFYP